MKRIVWMWMGSLLLADIAVAASNEPAAAATNGADMASTVITSTRLSYDQQKRVAIFEENVDVADPEIHIIADKLTVFFSEDNKVVSVEAEGKVTIEQADKKAMGEKATYSVRDGKVVLTGKPRIQRGRDTLTAETISFWRDTNRILCEPGAKLVIHSDPGSRKGALGGSGKDKF